MGHNTAGPSFLRSAVGEGAFDWRGVHGHHFTGSFPTPDPPGPGWNVTRGEAIRFAVCDRLEGPRLFSPVLQWHAPASQSLAVWVVYVDLSPFPHPLWPE